LNTTISPLHIITNPENKKPKNKKTQTKITRRRKIKGQTESDEKNRREEIVIGEGERVKDSQSE
jgi:hypothetical protein